MRALMFFLLLGVFLLSYAQEPQTPYDSFFRKSSIKYGLNSKVLKAICYVETRLNPYAIGLSRKGKVIKSYFPKSRTEAKIILSRLKTLPEDFNFDVGLCQISRAEMRALKIPPEALLNPKNNIEVAAYILKRKILRKGYTWKAISSYNGRRDYYEKVIKVLREWKVLK